MVNKIIFDLVCHEIGIVPLLDVKHKDVNRVLQDLSEEESRKMKRKFRKLWRKANKSLKRKNLFKGKNPSKSEKERRKLMVIFSLKKRSKLFDDGNCLV